MSEKVCDAASPGHSPEPCGVRGCCKGNVRNREGITALIINVSVQQLQSRSSPRAIPSPCRLGVPRLGLAPQHKCTAAEVRPQRPRSHTRQVGALPRGGAAGEDRLFHASAVEQEVAESWRSGKVGGAGSAWRVLQGTGAAPKESEKDSDVAGEAFSVGRTDLLNWKFRTLGRQGPKANLHPMACFTNKLTSWWHTLKDAHGLPTPWEKADRLFRAKT